MSDLKGTPGGEAGQVNAYYHDDGNGTHDEAKAAHLRGWDATDLQWYRLGVDHATGAVKMYLAGGDVNLTASARGGYTPFLVSALTGSLSVSASLGKFGGCVLINLNSAPAYLQVFDQGAASNVSLGSTTPTFSIPIPANGTAANGAAVVVPLDVGLKINNGIKVAATTTINGGAPVATALSGFIYYI